MASDEPSCRPVGCPTTQMAKKTTALNAAAEPGKAIDPPGQQGAVSNVIMIMKLQLVLILFLKHRSDIHNLMFTQV